MSQAPTKLIKVFLWDGKRKVQPVASVGLTSASSSNVMRVTSLLEGLRARRPLAFLEESHLRLTNVTRQLLQGCPPPVDTQYHIISLRQHRHTLLGSVIEQSTFKY